MDKPNTNKGKDLQQQIRDVLNMKGLNIEKLKEKNVEEILEEINIYHQELEFQNIELLQTQEQLTQSRQHYKDLFENAPIGYVIFDEALRIQAVNMNFSKMVGEHKNDIIGEKLSRYIHPETQDAFYFQTQLMLKEITDKNKGNLIFRANGRDYHTRVEYNLFHNEQGKRFKIAIMDITEQHLAEEKRRQEQHMHEQIIEHQLKFLNLIATISADFMSAMASNLDKSIHRMLEICGHFFHADRGYLFLFSEDKSQMSNTHEWCAKGVPPMQEKNQNMPVSQFPWWAQQITHKQAVHIPNIQQLSKEASIEKREFSAQGIKSLLNIPITIDKEVTGFFGFDVVQHTTHWDDEDIMHLSILADILSDALKKCKMEESLMLSKKKAEESDQLKSAFLANMSHEIRTPMNGIIGFTEILKRPHISTEQKERSITIIERSSHRLLAMINDIIDISKIESGQMPVYLYPVNINQQIQDLYDFFLPEAKQKEIHFQASPGLPNQEAEIESDNQKIYAILTNLIKNAIKYAEAEKIEFGYVRKDDFLHFHVTDNGIGISAEYQSSIFKRFTRDSQKRGQHIEGSGLGLSIAKAYAELLGGALWFESTPGIGTSFFFTLPYLPTRKKEKEEAAISSPASNTQAKKLKILIAEDTPEAQEYFSFLLAEISKELLIAQTGKEAVHIMHNNPDIDLVLMDIKMPEMDGYEAVKEIRQFNQHVPIFAQTAYAFAEDEVKALESGFNDYLRKPIKIKELFEKINPLLRI